jgi:hypothetical protein
MRRRARGARRPEFALLAAALALLVMFVGALVYYGPFLTRKQTSVSQVPAPNALNARSQFAVPPGQQACMTSVAVEPSSRSAQFEVSLAKPSRHGGPPIDLVLSAPGYRSVGHLAGGYPGGVVSVPVTPPPRSLLAEACFIDRGNTPAVLAGSVEARSISRSGTTVAGTSVVGDIALTFLEGRPRSLLGSLGTVFGHASNLTDHLIPVWLIWVIALLGALGVPLCVLGALYIALREDQALSS